MQQNAPAQSSTEVNSKKLYVGNLPYSMSEDDLRNLFSQYGEITNVTLIIDRMSGRSKGFGFVEFSADDAAIAAAEATNNMEIDGRAMVVNVARPQAPREDRGGFRPRFNDRGGNGGGSRGGSRGGFGGGRGGDRGGYGGGRDY
jgi:RNA recognition motif-containing protein